MFVYQKNFFSPCVPCTREVFEELTTCSATVGSISDARHYQRLIDEAGAQEPTQDRSLLIKQYEAAKAKAKRRIPALVFQAWFRETQSKKGFTGAWRKNSAAVLNGLYILDIDHLTADTMQELILRATHYYGSTILLAFKTASGHGLKFVAKADAEIGNIADNQRFLSMKLCCEFDSACKDPARLSFCPSKDDIVYINNEIFNYNNEKFDEIFGGGYRDGSLSRAAVRTSAAAGVSDNNPSGGFLGGEACHDTGSGADIVRRPPSGETHVLADGHNIGADADSPRNTGNDAAETAAAHDTAAEKDAEFGGVAFRSIIEKYCEVAGLPQTGGRHQWLLKMAKDIRYMCDFDKERVARVMMLCHVAKDVAAERGEDEIRKIAEAACSYRYYADYPSTVKQVMKLCGIAREIGKDPLGDQLPQTKIDYQHWADRLRPLLVEGDLYADACARLEDVNKLGGVLAAGCMYGTYLTRCSFPFYDGKNYRFSYLTYIIGQAASGKSFIIDMDRELMTMMQNQDDSYRTMEREYREKKERMTTSSKDAKGEAPKRPHYPVRKVPSTISNAKLYQRLQDAVDNDDETLHLHLFTLESELATALRVQVGSWAGKLDLELKSFQNEYAGVDYANEQSANGLIQVNWNQVISGTMDALRKKMRGGSITDGYITRMALWIMPSTDYRMITKNYNSVMPDDEAEKARKSRIRRRVMEFDKIRVNITDCLRLSDFCYDWCNSQCEQARLEDDACVEYFRKRIPIYMMRYTLPRIIDRNLGKFAHGLLKPGERLDVLDSDIEFARLIGDYLMFISIYQWGEALLTAIEEDESLKKPRLRKTKFAQNYFKLPKTFVFNDIRIYYATDASARDAISKLVRNGCIKKTGDEKWEKIKENIDGITLQR